MRVACLTPLPPSPSGVADYAAEILPALGRSVDLEVFVADPRSLAHTWPFPVFDRAALDQRHAEHPFDAFLYQMGNNSLHQFVFGEALRRPGAVVLHDALLQHLLLGDSWEAWEREFAAVYGERGREIARNLKHGDVAHHEGFFRYPLVGRLASASRAVVVHNPGAVARVKSEGPGAAVRELRLPFFRRAASGSAAVSRREARRLLGLPPGAFLVGCLGYLRGPRRMETVLRAFETLRRRAPRAELVVVGQCVSAEMEAQLAPRLRQPGIRNAGFVSDTAFEHYGAACDVVVNLRYPSAGETSGVAVRMMGLGVAVILTESEENSRYPTDACARVPAGEIEESLLLEYLLEMSRNAALVEAMGANAARHIAAEHDPETYVAGIVEVLTRMTRP